MRYVITKESRTHCYEAALPPYVLPPLPGLAELLLKRSQEVFGIGDSINVRDGRIIVCRVTIERDDEQFEEFYRKVLHVAQEIGARWEEFCKFMEVWQEIHK